MNINFAARVIELTKSEMKKASRYGTDEYIELCDAKKSFPTFKLVVKKTPARKEAFKGLTYAYMEEYIKEHDENGEILNAFHKLVKKGDDKTEVEKKLYRSYGNVRKWFLETYPAIGEYYKKTDKIINAAA